MAERDEINFEQEIREKLQNLDREIKIPEIPDVNDIFEKAEDEKTPYSLLAKRLLIFLNIEETVPPVEKKKTTATTATMRTPREKNIIAFLLKKQL